MLRECYKLILTQSLPLTELKCFKYNYLKQNVTPRDAIGLATWIEKTHNIPIVVEPNSTIIQSLKNLDFLNNNSLFFISEEIGSQSAKILLSKAIMKQICKDRVELKSSHEVAFVSNCISDGYFGDADPPFGDIDPPLGVYDIMSCISKNEKTIAKLLFFS